MLDKRIIYTKCMYNCLYHVSSVGKTVSLLDAKLLLSYSAVERCSIYTFHM